MPRGDTSRVELRSLTRRDRAAYLAATRASLKLHRPWVDPPTTEEGFAALIRRARDDSFEPMIARRREDGAIVGFLNVSQIIRGDLQSAFLGFGAVSGFEGRGYMTEGLMLVVRRASPTSAFTGSRRTSSPRTAGQSRSFAGPASSGRDSPPAT